ncbi:MAG: SDR family NAD(P)-dependent oxidoreductase [Paracoccaceae bacterium]
MTVNLFNVADTTVLVSGGSRGIGLALAEGFALQGAKVIITGRNATTLAKACETAKTANHPVTFQTCDVADQDAITSCVETVTKSHGRIDTLINSAGINIRKPVDEFTADEFDQIMNINLRGTFLMSQTVGKQMVAQGSGNQINIDSLSTYAPFTQILPYAMSKSAISSMTRGLALEWGSHGVRVNGLAPGFILTDLTRKLWSSEKMQDWHKILAPLQRLGSTDDLIATAIFLASPGAAFITGQILRVDGGASAGIKWPIAQDFEVNFTRPPS